MREEVKPRAGPRFLRVGIFRRQASREIYSGGHSLDRHEQCSPSFIRACYRSQPFALVGITYVSFASMYVYITYTYIYVYILKKRGKKKGGERICFIRTKVTLAGEAGRDFFLGQDIFP